jgi:hypothetical protein
MAPKPASTAGKAPASSGTASKAPAKTTEGSKAAKKTSKTAAVAATGDDTKKKRRKVRKETYSSYIYKGVWSCYLGVSSWLTRDENSTQASTSRYWYLQQGDGHLELVCQRYLRTYCYGGVE